VNRAIASELEFDKVLELVATQARTSLGRSLVAEGEDLPTIEAAVRSAALSQAVDQLLSDGGQLSFAGLDEAVEWLEPGAPAPTDARDLLTLLTLARRIAAVRKRLLAGPDELLDLASSLPDTTEIIDRNGPRVGRDGTIPDQASPELARLRRQMARLRQDLLHRLEAIRRGHPNVTTDAPPTVRRDRYCLPVRAGARSELPGLLLDTSGTGATAFVEPLEIVELNNQLAETIAGEREEVRRIVAEIAADFAAMRDQLADGVDTLALLDAAQARVRFGHAVGGRIVFPGSGAEPILRGVRHPLLDERLHPLRVEVFGDAERRDPTSAVVPLDFRLPEGTRTLVVSGPNAGGKTVVLKTLGLAVLMAYHGIPLPADEGTVVPRIDHIWCHIGDEQDVAADLSSFSGVMAATVQLLREAGDRSLVLYDELGAGTDPLEGAALGCALLEALTERRSMTVVTTHLAAIGLAAGAAEAMDNAAMGYDEDDERPNYTLTVGRPGRSRALEIAAKTGLDRAILDRARELLGGQHLELERWLRRLEELEQELFEQREDLAREQRELRTLSEQTEGERARLLREREQVPAELAAERDRLRRRAKQRLDEVLDRLDEAIAERERLGKRVRQRLRERALDIAAHAPETAAREAGDLEVGTPVRLDSIGGAGILEEVRGSRALVTVDGKRLWVESSEVVPVESGTGPGRRATVEVSAKETVEGELHLIGMDSERAREELERFLDQAFTAGRTVVRVVHGHGTGVLRRTVAEVCRSHPAVRSFRHPPRHLGGTGATEVQLHELE
jgi:DNA mismatch repair protein MutS2